MLEFVKVLPPVNNCLLPVLAHAQVYSVEEGGAVKMLCSNVGL